MSPDVIEFINQILDEECQVRGLKDSELAETHGVDRSTLWRWRHGDAGKAAAVLIPLIMKRVTSSPNP